MRLIDADVLRFAQRYARVDPESDRMAPVLAVDKYQIDKAPTIDATIVVRCGECKHWHKETGYCNQHSYFIDSDGMSCSPAESPSWTTWDEDDFCADGERKAENHCDRCMSGSYRGCDGCSYGKRKEGE